LFLLGWNLRRIGLRSLIDRRWVRPAAWVTLAGVFAVGIVVNDRLGRAAYAMREDYPGGGPVEQLPHAGVRGVLLLYGALGALAMIAVMPRRRIPVLTYLGTGSMYIYVIHALIVG